MKYLQRKGRLQKQRMREPESVIETKNKTVRTNKSVQETAGRARVREERTREERMSERIFLELKIAISPEVVTQCDQCDPPLCQSNTPTFSC